MSFFKSSKDKEDLKQGGTSYITSSGFFPVTILAAFVNKSRSGSETVEFYLEHEGQKQVLYGNVRVSNNDGSVNKIGAKVFNQLVIIADLEDVSDPVEEELPVGKKEAMKTVAVLEDISNIEVIMRVQMEYSVYEGQIQERRIIKSFYRAGDQASAEEIVNEKGYGETYEKELKYADNVAYKNELTEEDIQNWIKSGRNASAPSGAGSPKAKTSKGGFGKRTFGKNAD